MTSKTTTRAEAARLRVRVTPRASRNEVVGWRGAIVHLRVTAPPFDGLANAAAIQLIADAADLPRSAVRVVGGERSRDKLVRVAGLALATLRERLIP